MSLLRTVAAAKALRPRRLIPTQSISQFARFMSVITLEGESEIEKFRMINAKSILYFTATWYVPYMYQSELRQEESSRVPYLNFSESLLSLLHLRCPPCKQIKPIYKKLAEEHTSVAFGLVDVDQNADSALEFEISAVPTFVFFDGEHAVEKMTGADATQLSKLVEELKDR
jgi:thiol-disulfide isomerase/thioredoxin